VDRLFVGWRRGDHLGDPSGSIVRCAPGVMLIFFPRNFLGRDGIGVVMLLVVVVVSCGVLR